MEDWLLGLYKLICQILEWKWRRLKISPVVVLFLLELFELLISYMWYILLTAIGLTPGGSSTVHIYTQTVHRTTQLTTWFSLFSLCSWIGSRSVHYFVTSYLIWHVKLNKHTTERKLSFLHSARLREYVFNLLKPTGHVMHQQV